VGEEPLTGRRRLHDGDQLHIGPVVVIYHASAGGISTETIVSRTPRTRART
jgi:hypothetical protein